MLSEIRFTIGTHADPEKSLFSQRFFKTGKGEYAEGDQFIGITVPVLRQIVRRYRDLPLADCALLLQSPIHEERFVGLQIMVEQFTRGDEKVRGKIMRQYLALRRHVDNWDLVDGSAPHILGVWMLTHDRARLYTFARSRDLWERRIAIVATFAFIRNNEFADTLAIAELMLHDKHDLIHKAVGWMLREVGKRDCTVLKGFLDTHAHEMPRTMLRYAIEHFEPEERQDYLARK